MKLYEEKKEVLYSLAELYLDTKENNELLVNDGIIHSGDSDSISFLMLLALTSSENQNKNFYSLDFDIGIESQHDFVDREYKKIVNSKYDKIQKGKIILDDAKKYYNENYGDLDNYKIEEIANLLDDNSIHI